MADSTLMGPREPAFQERSHPVTQGQEAVSHRCLSAHYFMDVTERMQAVIAAPTICVYHAPRFHSVLNSSSQALAGGIRYPFEPNTSYTLSVLLRSYNHKCLSCSTTAPFPRFLAANIRFVHFDRTRQPISAGSDHSSSELMEPRPGGFVAPQSQNTFQSQCTRTIFLAGYPPNCTEPHRKRLTSALEDRPCCYRRLMTALRTLKQNLSNRPGLIVLTSRAAESFGPSQLKKIISAALFGREPSFEIAQGLRVILHGSEYNILCLPESRG